jgi:hypothetical protein
MAGVGARGQWGGKECVQVELYENAGNAVDREII